ncbi:MAG: extracellular matrix regulator RemB [Bacillota bacterium]
MFLHLGKGHMISKEEIVLIGDLESTTDSSFTEEFFDISEEEGFIVDYTEGNKARSFILTGETIYLSMISSTTLAKRAKNSITQSQNGRGY